MAICLAFVAAGCNSSAGDSRETAKAKTAVGDSSRVERCVERFMKRASPSNAQVRRYARTTYCEPFDEHGWVHANGTLRIDAYEYMKSAGTCSTASPGQPAQTVPCDQLDRGGPLFLDCALLHLTPETEVRKYLATLEQGREVRCDDDTPLSELGAA